MKKLFLLSAITLCLVARCALAQYQTAPAYGGGSKQQRKMSPSPSGYGQKQQQSQSYNSMQQQQQMQMHEMSPTSESAPNSYDQQSTSDDGQAAYAGQQQSYGKQQAQSGKAMQSYGGQQASGYAKQAAKYEEPQHPPMPFAWGYDINDGYGTTQYHKENGDEYGKRTGSYGYMDAYGVYRHVNYVADENGFRATVKTNEPGTANESPADVELSAEEPPANVNPGNKEKSAYADSSTSGYGSGAAGNQNGNQYAGQAGSSGGAKSSYGESSMMADAGKYGQSMMGEQAPMQQYGAMSMAGGNSQSAKSYQSGSGSAGRQQQQQYGAGMSQGMMAGLMAGKQQQQQQYAGGPAMGSAYGQQNGLMSKSKARRYGNQGAGMRATKGAYQSSMESEPSSTQSPYGQPAEEAGQQQYAGAMNRMGSMNSGYPSEQSSDDASGQQQYGADSALAQHYGPAANMLNAQMQQYGAGQAATSGEGSTYSSMRMQASPASASGSPYASKQSSMNAGAPMAYRQQQTSMLMADAGSMDYRRAAGKGIAALAAKRY